MQLKIDLFFFCAMYFYESIVSLARCKHETSPIHNANWEVQRLAAYVRVLLVGYVYSSMVILMLPSYEMSCLSLHSGTEQ